ncbi:MAG: hypothetical protein ABSF95_08015 [Verrucomicrobiota bacterium]|jgi:hypothetical protein
MNNKKRAKKSSKPEYGPCLCQGAGPGLSDFLRRLGPPEEARRHFEAARMELLKGLRAMLDARIAHYSKPQAKGENIPVE